MKPQHSVRKQRLLVHLDNEADALLLRPRLSDINRDNLLPAIERVLDELAVPGQRIKIDRLTLDLGTLPFERFGEAARERLEAALREHLGNIVFEATHGDNRESGMQANIVSEPEHFARIRLLEHYLVNGVLPWHAHDKTGFSCEALFMTLVEEQKDAVVDTIVRHYRLPRVIERLVIQLREEPLRKLLQLLEPRNAELILAYILDLGASHSLNPVLPVNARDFDRLVWILTLTYSVRERGTQFNRKSYLKSLIQGLAQSEGLKYRDVVSALHLGLKKIIKSRPLQSTLPALIATLAEEKASGDENKRAISGEHIDNKPTWVSPAPAFREHSAVEAATRLFRRYDRIDLLRYYLEHGTLSHNPFGPHNPFGTALNVNETVALLAQLPPHRVKAVFDFGDEQQQRSAFARAVEALSETELLLLLKRLFPLNDSGDDQFHASVRTMAKDAKSKLHYYSSLLAALFNNRELDLEQFAANEDNPPAAVSDDKPEGNCRRLKAEFLTTLKQLPDGDPEGQEISSPASAMKTMQSLIANDAIDTRRFILDIQATPELNDKKFNAFLKNISDHEFDQLVDLAQPDIAGVSKSLAALLASIPVPYRPGIGKLRNVILAQAIQYERAPPETFFSQVLHALFPTPLSKPLAEHLLNAADHWQWDDGLAQEQVAGFQAAIQRCVNAASLTEVDDPAAPENTEDNLIDWQNRVFSSLLPDRILRQSKHAELRQLAAIPRHRLPGAINRLLLRSPERFGLFVQEHIVHPTVRDYWTDILPESSLVRFIWLLEPQQLRALLGSAETLAAAWFDGGGRAGDPNKARTVDGRRELWLFLLEFFAGHSGANCTLSAMTSAFFDHFSIGTEDREDTGSHATDRHRNAVPARKLLDRTRQLAGTGGQNQLLATLHEDRRILLAGREERKRSAEKPPARKQPSPSTRVKNADESAKPEDSIYINNAGLVLVGVFLPHMFKSLDMLHNNSEGKTRLRDKATFSRAAHMLQYLVDGATSAPEPLLALNKILCGESTHATIERDIALTENETKMCDQLLNAVITNWTAISSTSAQGLRETFLQREGRLVKVDNGWKLTVQRKTVDILLDQVSWSFSVISQAWMPETVYVSW